MSDTDTSQNKISAEEKNAISEKQIEIDNHKAIAANLEDALKYHYDVAKYHNEGDHEKAHKSSIFALGHCSMARELLREDAKNHVLKGFI